MVEREISEARRDLDSAEVSISEQDHKWAIIKAYYSMFHAFRALLVSAGYLEKSHECLIVAVDEIFVSTCILPSFIITDIRSAKTAREAADYGLTYGEDAARGTLLDADKIIKTVTGYLVQNGYMATSP